MTTLPGVSDYVAGRRSFLVGATPPAVLALEWPRVVELLRTRHGPAVDLALSPEATDPSTLPEDLPEEIRSPRAGDEDSSWMRLTNIVGINIRTVGDLSGVVRYLLTLPAHIDSIHLLPIWEPGAVGSLYGMASWNLNDAFRSPAIAEAHPHLDTTARQLRAVSNLVHVTGRTIGLDVIPHTDRFSEQALANPDLFEWMRIRRQRIVDWSDQVVDDVVSLTQRWLRKVGPVAADVAAGDLFAVDEATRLLALFGRPDDLWGRTGRRVELLRAVKVAGLEPVPATMGVPFRGIEIDADPDNVVVDDAGLSWPDFIISKPESMSRVFSPLARYKLHELASPSSWEFDFSKPRTHVWQYVADHYAKVRSVGAFDFMRGDMAHVQMRPEGVPPSIDDHYDILGFVKSTIAREFPAFGYFAESFLPARDIFQFGEELDHLDASGADTTLGDLQSDPVGSRQFLRRYRRYLDDASTRRCSPAFTVFTADKDDPRFDEFYRAGSELRVFTALFLTDMPSYTSLGFELRDVRHEPVENEYYTKLFVFHETGSSNVYPSKARFGDAFEWGSNVDLHDRLTRLHVFAEDLLADLGRPPVRWLVPPDATGLRGTAVWQPDVPGSDVVFVANYDTVASTGPFGIPGLDPTTMLTPIFSSATGADPDIDGVAHNGAFHLVADVDPGEGRVYRISQGPRTR